LAETSERVEKGWATLQAQSEQERTLRKLSLKVSLWIRDLRTSTSSQTDLFGDPSSVRDAPLLQYNGGSIHLDRRILLSSLEDALVLLSSYSAALTARLEILEDDRHALDKEAFTKSGLTKAINHCGERANRWAQSGADLDVGLGLLWSGDAGAFEGFGGPSLTAWLSAKVPLRHQQPQNTSDLDEKKGLFEQWLVGGSLRWAEEELVATEDEMVPQAEAQTLDAWVGLERVSENFLLSAQYGYLEVETTNSALRAFDRSGSRYLVSTSYRVSDARNGFWVNVSYGSADGTIDSLNDSQILVSLRFGPAKPFGNFN